MRLIYFSLFSFFTFSCETTEPVDTNAPLDRAQQIVDQAIEQHGGDAYNNLELSYTFRKRRYQLQNKNGEYTYTRTQEKNGQQIVDEMTANRFQRTIDGAIIELSDSLSQVYANAVNSVNYFVQLPYRLNDEAVQKKYIGGTTIKNKRYEVVEVTFSKEGGGDDFDDQYYYWFDAETAQLDYLTYSFHVNEGGVRFRAAINQRRVKGIIVQDYLNYKAPKETPLADLPQLYESGELELLSTIATENPR
ncbi:MAG: DUF6503 family protein [Bacteroidota bacterium]